MRPYVIVAPGYTEKSAGVRALHLLCHLLNEMAVPAYLMLKHALTNPQWKTPVATPRHVRDGIVIYPEIVQGNPLSAPRVTRWMLNRPGYINGIAMSVDPEDYVVAFSRMIDDEKPILNLQTANEGIFHPGGLPPKRGDLFYVGKGSATARIPALELFKTEITRAWPATHPELADVLRRARAVFSYDTLSGVNYEATLCGTLCVIVPNGPYTREDIAKGELGMNGLAWGTEPDEIERAVRTLPDAYPQYLRVVARQGEGIQAFVQATQHRW
ncbi:MAG: hypothetical protein IPL75_21585 [Acidobacteria bacterium]|jgi:hypothetical protein|nr:hypothetical protein [Acidobacteriota bacterium]